MIPAHPPQSAAAYPVCPLYIPYRDETDHDSAKRQSDRPSSEYRDRLYGWCVVRQLPKLQNITVARFRRRNEAEEHLKVLRQLAPGNYAIAFDTPH